MVQVGSWTSFLIGIDGVVSVLPEQSGLHAGSASKLRLVRTKFASAKSVCN